MGCKRTFVFWIKQAGTGLLAVCLLLLCACAPQPESAFSVQSAASSPQGQLADEPEAASEPDPVPQVLALLAGVQTRRPVDEDFLRWATQAVEPEFCAMLLASLKEQPYEDGLFFELFGCTLTVLYDLYTGAPEADPDIYTRQGDGPVTLAFTGDINLADDWYVMQVLREMPGGIEDCITAPLRVRMADADILLVNNEFCFSDRGERLAKSYNFRAATGNVEIWDQLGVDIVSLANNHVYDFGETAFYDTLATLETAGIPYVGAGANLEEAARPKYFIVGGMKIAYVAASRAEKWRVTPIATEDGPGVLGCYEYEDFLQAVGVARENADVVVAYPHWGTENTTVLETAQIELGNALVEAGADLVVGAHPHCLQGVGWHQGKAIVYSLGNFWFNTMTIDTALLEVTVYAPGQLELTLVPCLQAGGVTGVLEGDDAARVLGLVQSVSPEGTVITEAGGIEQAGPAG